MPGTKAARVEIYRKFVISDKLGILVVLNYQQFHVCYFSFRHRVSDKMHRIYKINFRKHSDHFVNSVGKFAAANELQAP
ncbi:MAG: hypothetical protein DMF03_09510 [Verrucomicrobia bacterium]|nr:MAG: hypothetical protein DMF03_09510 [Verrucomicrobiota bacterium]